MLFRSEDVIATHPAYRLPTREDAGGALTRLYASLVKHGRAAGLMDD